MYDRKEMVLLDLYTVKATTVDWRSYGVYILQKVVHRL